MEWTSKRFLWLSRRLQFTNTTNMPQTGAICHTLNLSPRTKTKIKERKQNKNATKIEKKKVKKEEEKEKAKEKSERNGKKVKFKVF